MTYQEWQAALASVYLRSINDPVFRALCLTNAIEAVLQETGIVLPVGTKLEFWENPVAKTYSYRLPPVPAADATNSQEENALIQWATNCTDYPTDGPPN